MVKVKLIKKGPVFIGIEVNGEVIPIISGSVRFGGGDVAVVSVDLYADVEIVEHVDTD